MAYEYDWRLDADVVLTAEQLEQLKQLKRLCSK